MVATLNIAGALQEEFTSLAFARQEFPMLTDWGVQDESIHIHSLGCNYLSALGRHLGFWAMNEMPVRIRDSKYIRPDVVWWCRDSQEVRLIAEFERYEPGKADVVQSKANNLMETYEALDQQPQVLLLVPWVLSGTDTAPIRRAARIACSGFQASDGTWISGLDASKTFIQAEAIFGRKDHELRLLRVQQ